MDLLHSTEVRQELCDRPRQRRASWRVATNTPSTAPVDIGNDGPRVAMAVRGTGVTFGLVGLVGLVGCIDQAVGIDGKLDRRGACMDLSPCGRACPPARHVAERVQHLSPVLQGMRGAVYRAPVTWRSDPAPMPSTRARSQFIRSTSHLFRSSTAANPRRTRRATNRATGRNRGV